MHSLKILQRWPLISAKKATHLMQTASISVRTLEKSNIKEEEVSKSNKYLL